MDVFFIHNDSPIQIGQLLYLSSSESHHAVRVLRKKAGDTIGFMNGNGIIGTATIREADKKKCALEINDFTHYEPTSTSIHLYIGLPKSNDRTEWLLEKSTELGVREITPLILDHSERKKIKYDRAEKVILAACKQSQNPFLPRLNPYSTLDQTLEQLKGTTFFGHCEEDDKKTTLSRHSIDSSNINLFIGPEGDFSSKEIEVLKRAKANPIQLDNLRLRTETAAISGIVQLKLLNEFYSKES